jgi:membrane associated rhomboid family serine protease
LYFFFFYPVGTDAPRQGIAVGTLLLVLSFLAAWGVRYADPAVYADLVNASFRPSAPDMRAALLSLFLHGGWAHLLGNSLYTWIFGRQLESRIGFAGLLFLFVGGGLAGCWAQAWTTPPGSATWDLPVIGASGGVAALLGATMLRFHHQRVRVLWFLFAFLGGMTRGGVAHVNTVLAALIWFGFQIVHGLIAWSHGGSLTAYGSHAGGFLSGLVLGLLLGLPSGARREIHRERGRRHFERGDWHAAVGELTQHLRLVPDDDEARAMRARCHVVLGQSGEAAREYLDLFRHARQEGDPARMAPLYRQMRVHAIPSNLDERGLLRLAFRFQKAGFPEAAGDAYLELATQYPDGPKAELALIRRAELQWKAGDYEEALAEYQRLLEQYPASDWRELAEGRVQSIRALTGRRAPAWRLPAGIGSS